MKKLLSKALLAASLATAAGGACTPRHASFVKVDDVALGRVVVYRNGVAYYERRATVTGGALTVSVPRERVDDFLKSLTVVDAISGKPLPVSIPRAQNGDGPFLTMRLQLPTRQAADVVLTYVTEAPAWKPSYRLVVGAGGKVMLEGWAIVDNTSGEDWKGVLVGVGSSSALSFRYDLWSVRQVQRETLSDAERFAIAPPTGVTPYGGAPADAVLADLGDDEIRRPAGHPDDAASARLAMAEASVDMERSEVEAVATSAGRGGGRSRAPAAAPRPSRAARVAQEAAPPRDARVAIGDAKLRALPPAILRSDRAIVVEAHGDATRADAAQRAADRGNIVRAQLIDQGVAPARIKVVTKLEPGAAERVRLVAAAPEAPAPGARGPGQPDADAPPVGESHFASPTPMTVEKGSSAMVSMVRQETEGEQVYLYDAESERGNARFAFRAVRFTNPTDSTLETGPVTVYGDGRFIGEGLSEPVAPRASAVVPFALDRQIVVERAGGEEDKLARLVTVQRGVLTAEVQHVKRTRLTLTNRLRTAAKVYVRHTMTKGWTPLAMPATFERVGDAHLFEVALGPGATTTVEIAEATPIERTLDLGADVTLGMMKAYVDAPEATPALKEALGRLLAIHRTLADLATEQESLRHRLEDYRARMDELHAQVLTLQAVKTGGELMTHLKAKLKDVSERVQRVTIALVDGEEKMMLTRVQFQDALAELSLPAAAAAPVAAAGRAPAR